jgi:hypothetical protein
MGRKRFEKTRSRMVYHAILGLGDFPQQASRWQLLAKGTLLARNQVLFVLLALVFHLLPDSMSLKGEYHIGCSFKKTNAFSPTYTFNKLETYKCIHPLRTGKV